MEFKIQWRGHNDLNDLQMFLNKGINYFEVAQPEADLCSR